MSLGHRVHGGGTEAAEKLFYKRTPWPLSHLYDLSLCPKKPVRIPTHLSHPRQRTQSEQPESGFQNQERAGAKQEAARAHRGCVDQNFVGRVETAEFASQLVQIYTKEVRAKLRGRQPERTGEAREFACGGELTAFARQP